ncbi:hypothetical protein VOLCADRAFT_118360 [Volvox carteri f. nagariensis]|uniref:Uncharacterized protein n=1 Tax=Volvox carteri f. nagariensis TaxID=3068 RepID=D8U4G2_VOLCA|nr:uncharacterized protein VOLCADRAFT_118360 [Volvox carteri f. nagariensis]EFJ45399.1 hypothetical protein VOLCADRAFT_118360 [Volvox carteri f. nagariensis]|eukprot:XP_002953426.1 hypothetical protein VOLCADRAFT_118360 [Volvox carteri f. nagariensis]
MDYNGTVHATPAQLRLLEMQQEEVQQNAAKIQGLFQYLNFCDAAAFDRCLGRSGKSPDCLSQAPHGGPAPRKYATITTTSHNRKMRQQEASRSVLLMAQRKEPAALTDEETLARLKDVFIAYSDPMLYAHTGRREMNIVGFCRLMRDCRLLDNRLTLVAADVMFTRVEAGVDDEDGNGGSTLLGDLHVDFEEFMRCLRAVVRVKFPQATDPKEAMLLLARKWVLPFARDSGAGGGVGSSVDGLFSRSTMNLIRKYDGQLKKLFAWYSSMDETDPARVTWSWAREHAGAINSAQFVLMLLNFNVLPVLLSKHAAIEVFIRCEAANDGDERANAMFYPAFLETIAEVALEVGKYAVPRIRAATSPDDFKVLRRYADCCPPPHGPKLLEVYQEVLASRGRDASSLDQHELYDVEAARRRNEQQVASALEHQTKTYATSVVQRREGLRQRFALTRLRNFYRDVRTFNNNTTWPPERDLSPTSHRNNARPGGAGGDGEGVHVAFYDSERAIKTPRPVWIPVCNAGARRNHLSTDLPTPSGAAGGTAPAFSGGGGGGGNCLLLDTTPSAPAAAHGVRHSVLSGGGAAAAGNARMSAPNTFSPTTAAAYGYIRSPKPYQLKVSIEDRDEHEAILDLAERLPYIFTQSEAAAASARTSVSSVRPLVLPVPMKPRAVTAPAELSRRLANEGNAAASEQQQQQAAGGGQVQGVGASGTALVGEASSSTVSSRPRLPPVHHQLHRTQATAAALAILAGQPSPPPSYSVDVHIATIHLPPALGASTLHAVPSNPSLAASHSQISGLSCGASAYSPCSSHRFSPHSSLSRRRQGTRKRVDAAGLPDLQLPADSGPGSEVAAALDELDKFDDARALVAASAAVDGVGRGGISSLRHQEEVMLLP